MRKFKRRSGLECVEMCAEKYGLTKSEVNEVAYYVVNLKLCCGHYKKEQVIESLCVLVMRRDERIWRESPLLEALERKLHRAYPQLWS